MRKAGLVVWQAHQAAARRLRPGVTTRELNEAYRETFAQYGATSLFLNYGGPPPFPAEACISVNEEIVHGIPGDRVIREGDLVSLDTGCRLSGWCGDAAVTHAVGSVSAESRKLLEVTQGVLDLAIEAMRPGGLWSDVARQMESYVEKAGFSVVTAMVGHGIGQSLHEPPQVPNYYRREWAEREDFDLKPGVVLAIEPMVNVGTPKVACLEDQWTLVTADRKPSAHFEHTVAMTAEGPIRLTGPPDDTELAEMPDWLQDRAQWAIW